MGLDRHVVDRGPRRQLTGDGPRTVSVEYGDGGTWSDPASASILLDTTAPTIDSVAVDVTDPVNNGWEARYAVTATEVGSGIDATRRSLNGTDWGDWGDAAEAFMGSVDLGQASWEGPSPGATARSTSS